MPLPSVDQFIGTNVTEQGFKDAQKQFVEYVGNEVPTNADLNNVSANIDAKITPKADKTYVDSAVTAVAGGHKAYTTLALAQAAQASLPANSIIEVTNDSDAAKNGTYQWNGTALTKSAYDPLTQAKGYTDQKLTVIKQLYLSSNNVADKYINIGTQQVTSSTGTALNIFSVEAGKTYAVKSSRISASVFGIALKETNSTATAATLGLVSLVATSDPYIKTFTIPTGSTAKYAFVNIKIPGSNFDITNDLYASEATADVLIAEFDQVQRVNGALVVDLKAREEMLTEKDVIYYGELYDKINNATDKYVVIPSGNIASSSGLMLNVFPVEAGKSYAIKTASVGNSALAVALRSTNSVDVGSTLGIVELFGTADPTVKKFSVPTGSTAKYAFINVKVPSTGLNIENDLSITMTASVEQTTEIASILGSQLADLKARESLKAIENQIVSGVSNLSAKTWVAIGDSITEKNFRATKNYHDFVSEQVGGMTVYNYGISGSGFWNRAQTIANSITQVPDYITLFWGANDLIRAPKILGTRDSTGTDSLGGLMNIAISALITKFYNKKFAVFTLLPRSNYNNVTNVVAIDEQGVSQGYTATQVADLIIAICEKYSIPVLDLYRESNLYPWITEANAYYFTAPSLTTPDGLHPNDAGQELIAYKIRNFMESL